MKSIFQQSYIAYVKTERPGKCSTFSIRNAFAQMCHTPHAHAIETERPGKCSTFSIRNAFAQMCHTPYAHAIETERPGKCSTFSIRNAFAQMCHTPYALLFFSLILFSNLYAQEKPLVVSSASIFADMASAIGGDLIESVSIVPIGGDPHIYEPTPGDVRVLVKANLILQNGLTFEGWITDLIKNSGSKAPVITITDGIIPITSEMHQNATDPHAWMEPVNGKVYAHNIKAALLQLLPNHHEQITAQFDKYIAQLDELDNYIKENIARIDTNKRILITSHDSFHYYGRRYGLRLESVMGTSTDADVRTSDLIRLNEVIQQHKIPVVFIESTINPKLLNQVAADNDISIGGKLYSDSLGDKDSPASTYLKMVRHNTDVIVSGLTSALKTSEDKESTGSSNILKIVAFAALLIAIGIFLWRKKIFTA
jgi:ABC-type Zn uptake system ZnuABC Zn-binding protein ZnuA